MQDTAYTHNNNVIYENKNICFRCVPQNCIVHEDVQFISICNGSLNKDEKFDWMSGYLPYTSSNNEILSSDKHLFEQYKCKIFAGLNGTDPFYSHFELCNKALKCGFSGVMNYPSVGIIDGALRASLEHSGFGYDKEIELIREAVNQKMMAAALVFDVEDAVRMEEAGANIILLHPGITQNIHKNEQVNEYCERFKQISVALSHNVILLSGGFGDIQMDNMARLLLNTIQGGTYF